MKKVLVISLNGRAYSFEEDAFQSLHAYLESADKSLAQNPDREEILLDLEQAVGEKCNAFLNQRKNVVTAVEISQVLLEMGPVGNSSDSASGAKSQTSDKQSNGHDSADIPKRLYLLQDGAIIAGLCTGIAAFLKVDVSIVRIVFVIFSLLSFGTGILIYLSLIFIIPFAQTLEERSAAQGIPFTAQELIEGTKRKVAMFSRDHIQNRNWRRDFKKRWESKKKRDDLRRWKKEWQANPHPTQEAFSYQKRIFYGFLVTLLTIVHAVFSATWILVLLVVASTGSIFGHSFTSGVPLWAEVLIIFLLGNFMAEPLRSSRHKIKQATGRFGFNWLHSIDDVIWLALLGGIFWYAYLQSPEVHAAVESLPAIWDRITASWEASVK